MKYLKKLLPIVLTAVVGSSMGLMGCKDKPKQVVNTPNQAPIEITWMNTMDLATNQSYTTKKLPELLKKKGFDVTIKVREFGSHDGADWGRSFQTAIAAGEKPTDIIQLGGMNVEAIKAGWFAELNMDLLKKNMPKYVTQVNKIYDKMWAFGKDAETGKLYGIPSFNMFGPNRHTFAYRQDWLKKLNMEVPKNLEEFEKWLIAVREKDPNGNGQKDEYGYTSGTDGAGTGFNEIFGAFGVMPGQWIIKDGKVVNSDIQPEVKDALALLRRWYSEDLLPKGIMTTSKRDNDFYAGLVGTWGQAGAYAPAIVPSGSYYQKLKSQQPTAELVAAQAPKGPKGDYGTWEWGPKKYVVLFGKHLEKDQKKLETLLRMLETIATDKELFEVAMFGEKGTHWDFVEKGAAKGATKFLEPWTDFNKKLNEVGVRELSESAFCPIWVEEIYKDYMDPLAIKYADNKGYFDPLLGIPLPSNAQYNADLGNLTKATYLDIITGKKPLSAFDEYVTTWKKNGGDILVKEANELYGKAFK
jgi:putative aldouronate transport system substrate-binding protein